MPDADKNTQTFRIWDPKHCTDDPFADAVLGPADMPEARLFAKAARGDKLNLSTSEIDRFKAARPTLDAANAALRAVLRDRYAAYLKNGLKGIAPYARARNDASPADEIAQALRETIPVAPGKELIESLLSYPADRPANVRDRFYWNKQTVEDRPTFLVVHRAESRGDDLVLVTEAQFYVGHSYNSNFMAAGGLAVNGGSLVFYVNRTFTDQVAGFGSGTKHAFGRRQMLGEISSNLSHIREALLE
jgi:hypothetical protein